MSNPDVPRTKDWEPWGPDDLISEWRENGVDEEVLNNVVQGLQFRPNGNGLLGHRITPGIAYIDGYRVKYDIDEVFDFVASTYYTFWAILKFTADPSGGVSDAWIEIRVQSNAGSIYDGDPPTFPKILLGYIVVGGAGPFLTAGSVIWKDNLAMSPEEIDGNSVSLLNMWFWDRTPIAPGGVGTFLSTVWSPQFYYKMSEGITASLKSETSALDVINPKAVLPFVRPVRARRGKGQLFDAYMGGVNSYRFSTNPTYIKAEGLLPLYYTYFFSIWAYPFRDDVDMFLLFKDQDFYLKWNAASKKLEFYIGNGAGGFTRFVESLAITSFKNTWFHISFGFNNATNKHWIVVNDGAIQIEIGTGARGVAATDFYMGNNDTPDTPFYGILDEFCKFTVNDFYHRLFIHELYNHGVGLRYISEGEGNRKSLIQFATYMNAPIAIGANAGIVAPFNTGEADPYAWINKYYNAALYRFNVPRAGIFEVHARVTLDNPIAGGHYYIATRTNIGLDDSADFHAVDADDLTLQITAVISFLAAADFIEVYVYNDTGVIVNLKGGASNSSFIIEQMA